MSNKIEIKAVAVGYSIPIIEAEAGWGTKYDGYMVGVSTQALKDWQAEFEKRNSREYGLYYEKGVEFKMVTLTNSAVKILEQSSNGCYWFNNVEDFEEVSV